MMMTISSAKKGPQIQPPANFHQWAGNVKRKVKDGDWQQVYVRITRSALKCYQNEVRHHFNGFPFFYLCYLQTDEEPTTTFNLQSFEIQAQHEDEEKSNVLVLSNGPAIVKFSWKDFKVYTYVLDVRVFMPFFCSSITVRYM